MRLYHRTYFTLYQSITLILLPIVLWGCSRLQSPQSLISIRITADHKEFQVNIASGSTVSQAIKSAQITLGEMDKVEPGLSTLLTDGSQVKITRIKDEFYSEQVVIPFEHQELRNEALPEGDRRLSQVGVNGVKEITYRRVYEDGVEISNSVVNSVVIKEATPEIEMIGSRSMFAPLQIPGTIAYVSAGNAWIIENNTAERKLVVSTADLDGRIFSLSKDGKFLLFTRFSSAANEINTLWMASLRDDPIKIIDLGVRNIVHFAEFNPGSDVVAYSTGEWREASPGWQATNDLYELKINDNGVIDTPQQDLEPNSGGVYGWWGTEFSWAPDQSRFLYSRPDSIGIIDEADKTTTSMLDLVPYQTGGNWAWVPGVAWSPDGNVIYAVNHTITETAESSESQQFDLIAIPLMGGPPVDLVENVGMFAYPVPSPITQQNEMVNPVSGDTLEQNGFLVAYLQAVSPDQSESSRYRLFIMDRDGSNRTGLFPEEGADGLEPQHVAWSPAGFGDDENYSIALVYNGNIWIIDAETGKAQQVSGDGLTTRLDWR